VAAVAVRPLEILPNVISGNTTIGYKIVVYFGGKTRPVLEKAMFFVGTQIEECPSMHQVLNSARRVKTKRAQQEAM